MYKPSFLLCSFLLFAVIALCSACQSNKKEIVQKYPGGGVSRRHVEINGKKEGAMIEYYKDGKIKGERMFKDDVQVGVSVNYYPGGAIKERLYFNDEGMKTGGDTIFYESGKPQFLRNWDNNQLHGYIRKWAEDGTVIYEARYEHDQLVEVKGEAVKQDSMTRHSLDTARIN